MRICRRGFVSTITSTCVASSLPADRVSANDPTTTADRIKGMLIGSLIGDALGGPLEFATDAVRSGHVAGCRHWDDQRKLDPSSIAMLGDSLTMMDYREVRPEPAPYGPWKEQAPAGTLTDDSRHKIILLRALRESKRTLKPMDLARAIIEFQPQVGQAPDDMTSQLLREGLAEYRYAARWILGERSLRLARPLGRLWAGVANCSGQMMLTPLAGCFVGRPQDAYQHCFELDFIDGPAAKDITAALVAGLAETLSPSSDLQQPSARWDRLESAMRGTDPYGFADVPFVGRPLHQWMDLADSIVRRSGGRPRVAYQLLETEGKPVYFWDAHFTLLAALVLLKLTDYHPLASLQLAIDFGHDVDSYAQLMGAMIGAVHGESVFPESMRNAVSERLRTDFAEDIDDWTRTLQRMAVSSTSRR